MKKLALVSMASLLLLSPSIIRQESPVTYPLKETKPVIGIPLPTDPTTQEK